MNYVVGGRSTDDDPLVWHLAGSLKSKSNAQGEKFLDRGLGVGAFPAKNGEKWWMARSGEIRKDVFF